MIVVGDKERTAEADAYTLNAESLRQHVLVTGGPGMGKTNTCWQLASELSEKSEPFLIIETQGKTFRKLPVQLQVYSICDDGKESIRFNPLKTQPHVRILAHIQTFVSLTSSSFNLSVTSSKVLEKALYAVYNNHGWNLFRNKNPRLGTSKSSLTDLPASEQDSREGSPAALPGEEEASSQERKATNQEDFFAAKPPPERGPQGLGGHIQSDLPQADPSKFKQAQSDREESRHARSDTRQVKIDPRAPRTFQSFEDGGAVEAFPTLLELLEYIESPGFSTILAGNPPQELVRAIDSLVSASSGAVFNTKLGLPDEFFQQSQVLVECETISDVRNKCFFVGMLLLQIHEHYIKPDVETPKKTIMIDDAIHLSYLMGLPGRRVGDDQKEDSWIPLSSMLGNLRRLGLPVVISMQACSKLSHDLIALFGTRIFHRIEVQQAKLIAADLPEDLDQKDLYKCPVGSAWIIAPESAETDLVRIPLHTVPARDTSVAMFSQSQKASNCRYAGCSSFPGACEDNTFTKAREIAESQAFRTIYVNYFLSCQKDLTQLVHYRGRLVGELQSQIGKTFPDLIELSWCTICQATEWYFDKLAREHGWSYADLQDQKERWFTMLRPAFLPEWPTRRINIDDLRNWREDFWKLKQRDQGPLPLCGECECKCRFGSDVEQILKDPRNENDFFKSLSGETEPLSKAAAWFCWLFSERIAGEPDLDLAYCFAAHFLGRANLSVDAQLVFAHKTRLQLEEARQRVEAGEDSWTDTPKEETKEETEKEARRRRSRERRRNRPEGEEPPLKPVP
ncbi:MAG: type IV secretion system DNA-binding domain-containing protein [Candidatus Melainabacteria bacterium]|nr:type IV secretion system DNA-binding domain-containing protein [Candidatus Melainabacteria bacterium]